VGERRVVENLRLAARAARERGEPLGHVLLSGPAGLGKTTLARLLARECGAELVEIVAGNIGDPHQLISLLSRMRGGGFLFLDEIHGLEKASEECLYTALEDGVVDAVLREGGQTRVIRVRLEPFTLVGATTRLGAVSEPFRGRFGHQERLEPYGEEELAEVVKRAALRLGTAATPEAAREVARRARGTPREALRILRRARDFAQVEGARGIRVAHVGQAAESLGIDEHGLGQVEQRMVKLLLRLGRPMGLEAIAARLNRPAQFGMVRLAGAFPPWLCRSGSTILSVVSLRPRFAP